MTHRGAVHEVAMEGNVLPGDRIAHLCASHNQDSSPVNSAVHTYLSMIYYDMY